MRLGAGGFADVCMGLLNDKAVAIKKLRPSDEEQEKELVAEMREELRLQSSLYHRNIVYTLGMTVSPPQMVLEYMAGARKDATRPRERPRRERKDAARRGWPRERERSPARLAPRHSRRHCSHKLNDGLAPAWQTSRYTRGSSRCRSRRCGSRSACWRKWPPGCPTCTARAWCTATSSRRTCC